MINWQVGYSLTVSPMVSPLSVCEVDYGSESNHRELKQYDSIEAYREGHCRSFGGFDEIKQIAANQTSFTALTSEGQVYTWGDARYEACLGRAVADGRYFARILCKRQS